MDFEVVEVNRIDEIILIESCLGMTLEFVDCGIQPNWFAEIEFVTDSIQSVENLVCSGIVTVVANSSVTKQSIVFKDFSP